MRRPRLHPLLLCLTLLAFCAPLASGQTVYWTDRNNAVLNSTDLTTSTTTPLTLPTGGRLQDVDLDPTTGILYYADWGAPGFPGSQGTISEIPKIGGLPTFVCGPGTLRDAVHQLALDPANQQIYFTQAVSYDGREVGRVDYGPGCTNRLTSTVINPDSSNGWFPSGLALDLVNDILYWGDPGVLIFPNNGSVNQMTASTLSAGPLPIQLTPHVNGRGRGFALDPVSQTIFLTSHDPSTPGAGGSVFAYDIATGVETLIIGPDNKSGYWDIEIDPVSQRIWYTVFDSGQIRSANFDGSDVQIELSGLSNPYGLALDLGGDTSCTDPSTAPSYDGGYVLNNAGTRAFVKVSAPAGGVVFEFYNTSNLIIGDPETDTESGTAIPGVTRLGDQFLFVPASPAEVYFPVTTAGQGTKVSFFLEVTDECGRTVDVDPEFALTNSAAAENAAFALASPQPNPVRTEATIRFSLDEARQVRLVVYDVLGREVTRLHDGMMHAGEHTARLDVTALPAGLYVYRLEADGRSLQRTLTVAR